MKYQISKRNYFAVIIQLFFIIIVGLLCGSLIITNKYIFSLSGDIYFFSVLGIFSYVLACVLWKRTTGVLYSPYIMFLTSFVIFQFGQAILFVFGLEYERYNLFNLYRPEDILKAIIYTLLSISMFNLGALLTNLKKKLFDKENVSRAKQVATISAMKQVGLFLVTITAPLTIYFSIYRAVMALKYGYGIIYSYNFGTNDVTQLLESLFLPSMYMFIIANTSNKKLCKLLCLILCLYALLTLLTGSRTIFIMIILSVLWLWNILINPFKVKSILGLLIFGFFLVILIPSIAELRSMDNKSISNYFDAFSNSTKENPVVKTVGELGGSMGVLLMIKQFMPEAVSFQFGQSYFFAIFSLIPNFFNFMGPIHPSREHAMLDLWLQNYLGLSYGPGFSMVAESYYNFGWGGIFLFVFWGFLFGKILGYKKYENLINHPLKLFIIISVISTCFTLPRIHTLLFVRTIIYYVLIPCLIIILVRNNKLNKKLRKKSLY
ncbi:O-antigen polysaccharide polymerase Wzy [Fictibacillus sp. UD]|uniref:O-antigen polysaccharide polymerase Wzy n=1 Tax=Fictibacillus sp. UD TaxID=3038777 RepID=UPI003745DF1A